LSLSTDRQSSGTQDRILKKKKKNKDSAVSLGVNTEDRYTGRSAQIPEYHTTFIIIVLKLTGNKALSTQSKR